MVLFFASMNRTYVSTIDAITVVTRISISFTCNELSKDCASPWPSCQRRWLASVLLRLFTVHTRVRTSSLATAHFGGDGRPHALRSAALDRLRSLHEHIIIIHHRLSSVFHATHRLDIFPQSSSSNSFSEPLVQGTFKSLVSSRI